jgi:hypothetical protein
MGQLNSRSVALNDHEVNFLYYISNVRQFCELMANVHMKRNARPGSSLRTGSSASTAEPSFAARLREFDRSTESQFRILQQQNLEDLSLFDREWLLNHSGQLEGVDQALAIRDVALREEAILARERVESDRIARRAALIRKQQRAVEEFMAERRRERSRMRENAERQEPPPQIGTARLRADEKPKKKSQSFLAGRAKFVDSQDVKLGRFRGKQERTESAKWGNLLDAANLERVLEETDRRSSRRKTGPDFVQQLHDPGNTSVSHRSTLEYHPTLRLF